MKKIFKSLSIFLLLLFIIDSNVLSKATNIGTKDFKLGATRNAIDKIIKQKYSAKDIERKSQNSIKITLKKVSAELFFDYKKILYKIKVQIDADSGGAAIKKKMISRRYGDPLVESEKYFQFPKLFLMARWLVQGGRYEIKLFESKHCRTNSPRPCVIVTVYKDKKLERENNARKEGKKIKSKSEKEKEKYDF